MKIIKGKIIIIFNLSILFSLIQIIPINWIKIFISPELLNNQKYWVGETLKINVAKFPENSNEKIYYKNKNNNIELLDDYLFLKSNGIECLTAFTKLNKINSTICFNIYNTPELKFQESDPIIIESYDIKQLNFENNGYPESNIKYNSSNPDIIKVNDKGLIKAIRPGHSNITAYGLDNKSIQISVISISTRGLIKDYTLDLYNAKFYQNLMIVAHPDDEILWGGANLYKYSYFVVCLTNGYNLDRAKDYRKILKFTKNSGMILDYPDLKDNNVRDDWSEVKIGILKDLSVIVNYKYWNKIVTHGPEGTTGHIHHKKTCEYVTKIVKESNKYKNLYYFGKFYHKNKIPKYLPRINDNDLKYKIKEVLIYKSVKKIIYKLWFHMLPYENWIQASNWKK